MDRGTLREVRDGLEHPPGGSKLVGGTSGEVYDGSWDPGEILDGSGYHWGGQGMVGGLFRRSRMGR